MVVGRVNNDDNKNDDGDNGLGWEEPSAGIGGRWAGGFIANRRAEWRQCGPRERLQSQPRQSVAMMMMMMMMRLGWAGRSSQQKGERDQKPVEERNDIAQGLFRRRRPCWRAESVSKAAVAFLPLSSARCKRPRGYSVWIIHSQHLPLQWINCTTTTTTPHYAIHSIFILVPVQKAGKQGKGRVGCRSDACPGPRNEVVALRIVVDSSQASRHVDI